MSFQYLLTPSKIEKCLFLLNCTKSGILKILKEENIRFNQKQNVHGSMNLFHARNKILHKPNWKFDFLFILGRNLWKCPLLYYWIEKLFLEPNPVVLYWEKYIMFDWLVEIPQALKKPIWRFRLFKIYTQNLFQKEDQSLKRCQSLC